MWRAYRTPATSRDSMITLYGISNCDTVKKARTWLEAHSVAYTYHDFRANGLSPETLMGWVDTAGWETLLNRRSRSWKELPENERSSICKESALRLMLANPTLIKRPVVTVGERVITGFNQDEFDVLFINTTILHRKDCEHGD